MSHASYAAALEHVGAHARARKAAALEETTNVLAMCDASRAELDAAVAKIRAHACIALHFHPDRRVASGQTVAESLLESGRYTSQFETGISSGSVSAFAGGARDTWERQVFGGAYHVEGVTAVHRPKYGALDLLRHADGPAPRFGSCRLVLAPHVSERSTFTYLDSHRDPPEKGTLDELDDIVAALLSECFTRDFALGEKDLRPQRLIRDHLARLDEPPALRPASRNLDHYIEAQVHGDVLLERDVSRLVADPSFQGTLTGDALETLCGRYAIDLAWHDGFELPASEVPTDFRGPRMPALAARVAPAGLVDAAALGEAAVSETPQDLKLLWHVLVRFGHPRRIP